jgi:hypothetical protein
VAAAVIAFVLAIAMVLHGASERVRDRRLRARLLPIEARLVDPGRSAQVELAGAATVRTDDDHLPSSSTHYTARWRYEVGGIRHEGAVRLDVPVFAESDVTFGRVRVLYDPENPSFSTVPQAARDKGKPWFIGAGIVVAFGVMFLIIARRTGAG